MKKNDVFYLEHILLAINKLEVELAENSDDETKQIVSERLIAIIGEAAKKISENTKQKYPDVEWKAIAGTRDNIIHDYFGVDQDIVNSIIKNEIPVLKEKIQQIINEINK